jgi:hypothetical protein
MMEQIFIKNSAADHVPPGARSRESGRARPLPINRDSEGGPCGMSQTTPPLAPAVAPLRPQAVRPIVRGV